MKHLFFFDKRLRKQVDPKFRRQEREKEENLRVSQWLDRSTHEAKHILKNDMLEGYRAFRREIGYLDRRNSAFVEAQIRLLYDCLLLLKERGMEEQFHKIKNDILRTLSFQHQDLRNSIAYLNYK